MESRSHSRDLPAMHRPRGVRGASVVVMSGPQDFDEFEHTYGAAVDDAVAFSHQGHGFFTRAKVIHLVDIVQDRLGDPTGMTVLDVGCGPGATDRIVAPMVGALHGVDVSPVMVSAAARANPNCDYQVYDGEHLPFDDGVFDVTFAICVLHHVESQGWIPLVAEMGRVTRPGGMCVVFEHNPHNPLTRRAVRDCPFDEGVTLLSRKTTSALLVQSGFNIVESRYILFLPYGHRVSHAVDQALGWFPLGGQYLVAASTPHA